MTELLTPNPDHAALMGRFSEPVREWFRTSFPEPTTAQQQGWPAISEGDHTLILAPTGSGKTLTAFMWAINQLTTTPPKIDDREHRTRVIYLSPLRALAVDVDKNLRAPLLGIQLAAERLGMSTRDVEVGVRTGDTDPKQRRRLQTHPPDILITTPESLYLYLTSRARETLQGVETIIIDEIHALATTKRGAHMALTLERLEQITDTPPQRIGLSATQRPLDEIARFLGGHHRLLDTETGEIVQRPRPVTIVDAGVRKQLDLEVVIPLEDMSDLGEIADEPFGHGAAAPQRKSIWPAIHPRLLELVNEHRSTLIFVNARRLAERLAARLNELEHLRILREQDIDPESPEAAAIPVPELVMAHHGSLSRERRLDIEDRLKAGKLRGLVATSSLELGIDMGAVDLVIQVASPGSVSRGLQRVGRAGHQVGQASRGRIFPKFRGDLLESAVVVERMEAGDIESSRYIRNPIDVLAQHIVAMAAMDELDVTELRALVRGAANFAEIGDETIDNVLDLLAGRYPSDEFAELRPRIVWDRVAGSIRGRKGAQRLAVTNPGTIPDRGLFGVFLPDGARVGELDEEMVHESRVGETFVLGASTWRIEDITYERVIVTPAPGEPGKLPFWHGDGPGRPYELGAGIGKFVRETRELAAGDREAAQRHLQTTNALDAWAADNLLGYLEEQAEITGHLPDDRTIVIERFRDEIGDWRICILSPFGSQVHAPWAMALEARLAEQGVETEILWADDGIVLRLQEAYGGASMPAFGESPGDGFSGQFANAPSPEWSSDIFDDAPKGRDGQPIDDLIVSMLQVDPDDVERIVTEQVTGTAMFSTTFREAAGRALLLPKRRPDQRRALWQQRQKAASLLQVASRHPTFPILLEATRECLQDNFDLPALQQVLRDVHSRKIRIRTVQSERASPFAASLMFTWVGTYMYEYDAPLAERRAAALSLDRDLLNELLGGDELRELIDPGVLADLELELQHLADGYRARDADELHDVLRRLGPLTREELDARCDGADGVSWAEELVADRRAIEIQIDGDVRIAAAEDAARLRDGLGVALPMGLPTAFTDPVARPLEDLVARHARTHGPFLPGQVARRLGIPAERVRGALTALGASDRVITGEFRPGGVEREWIDPEVLRRLRRRSLARLRHEVEPVDGRALARFQLAWHHITGPRQRGTDALLDAIAKLQGAAIPASVLETDVFPARVEGYEPAHLDALLAAGEVAWLGAGGVGAKDGRVVLCFRDQVPLLAPAPVEEPPADDVHEALREHLRSRGASFWPDLLRASGVTDQTVVLDALWDLVWAGEVTNDTFAAVRALATGGRNSGRATKRGRPRPGQLRVAGPPTAAGRWSLVSDLTFEDVAPTFVHRARAETLLERYGVLTREATLAENVRGGFAGVYPVLKVMEETGRIRRGYFVEGLGAAQFATPGAVDRLRDHRDVRDRDAVAVVVAATDPAQPYGAALSWPESAGRPARAAGAFVVIDDGRAAAFLERGAKTLVTFPAAHESHRWIEALTHLVARRRLRKLELTTIDGEDAFASPFVDALRAAGFRDGHRGLTLQT